MHGRGCSHDMGAGRNFWVSGEAGAARRGALLYLLHFLRD